MTAVMTARQLAPSDFNKGIKECSERGDVRSARQLYDDMIRDGVPPNATTFHQLLFLYSTYSTLQDCENILTAMRAQNIPRSEVTYNLLIKASFRHRVPEKAEFFLQEMIREGVARNAITCIELIKGSLGARDIVRLERYIVQMHNDHVAIPSNELIDVLTLFKECNEFQRMAAILQHMQSWGVDLPVSMFSEGCDTYEYALAEVETLSYALVPQHVAIFNVSFKKMCEKRDFRMLDAKVPTLVKHPTTFIVLIMTCCEQNEPVKALEYLQLMRNNGMRPNKAAYTALVKAFAATQDAQHLQEALNLMEQDKIAPDASVRAIRQSAMK